MGERSSRLGLVMGLGRSGTTFLAKLIDSSPDVLYRHEPDAVLPVDMPSLISRDDLERYVPKAKAYVEAMTHCRRLRANGHLPIFKKAFRSSLGNLAFRPMVLSTKALRKVGFSKPDTVPDLIAGNRGDPLYLIKSVSALGRAKVFAEASPHMASIHILRHPCAVIASTRVGIDKGVMGSSTYLTSLFAQPETARYPYSHEMMKNATFEEQAAYRWMLMNDKAATDMKDAPGYLRIRYEDLCNNVEPISRKLFDHLGLKVGAQTERFIREVNRPPSKESASIAYFKVKRPITSALDKWTSQLGSEEVERIREVVSHSPLGRAYFEKAAAPTSVAAAS